MHLLATAALYAILAWHGLKKKSLSRSGAIAAAAVCFPTFLHPSYSFMAGLLTFYLSASRLTKVGTETKEKLEEDFKTGGQRNATQVFSNGFTGTLIVCLHYLLVVRENNNSMDGLCFADGNGSHQAKLNTALMAAYIGHYACCNGDTWASELGVLSKSLPRLITTLKSVPKGTNGAISVIGTLASISGGAFVGLAFGICLSSCWSLQSLALLLFAGALFGFVGSMIDSLLGATLQRSTFNKRTSQITQDFRRVRQNEEKSDLVIISGWELLDNHQINFISSGLTAVIAGVVGYYFF
ncbi:integral membrane protein DUF92-domain-containing protein [Obelidium mucronatum]|nr:integral membrane protein DUF92-domain-containing protein [Obelidium mucronatum]